MSENKVKFLILIAAIGLVGFGFWLFGGQGVNDNESSVGVAAVGSQEVGLAQRSIVSERQELLEILTLLRSIKLNTDFFTEDSFQNLVDFSVQIGDETPGRANPFLPFGQGPDLITVTTDTTIKGEATSTDTGI